MKTSYDTIYDLCVDAYSSMRTGSAIQDTIIVHNESLEFNIYKLRNNFTFDSQETVNSVFSLCVSEDAATQIIICNNIVINEGVILTPPYRCKGLIIFNNGITINNGTISMTARGASAEGQDVYLFNNQDFYEYVPAIGAAGGAFISSSSRKVFINGKVGETGILRQTGGGGSGGISKGDGIGTAKSGVGGTGTSFSGGSGGGAAGTTTGGATATRGSSTGGAGGNGYANSGSTASSRAPHSAGGGAGNPGGNYSIYTTKYPNTSAEATNGEDGTGGLLIIYSYIIQNLGLISSNGSQGGHAGGAGAYATGGGASGGGSINLFCSSINEQSEIYASGGIGGIGTNTLGGNGGDGCITTNIIEESYFIPASSATFNKVKESIYNNMFNELKEKPISIFTIDKGESEVEEKYMPLQVYEEIIEEFIDDEDDETEDENVNNNNNTSTYNLFKTTLSNTITTKLE